MRRDTTVCSVREIKWWHPTTPVFYKLVNGNKKPAIVFQGKLVTRIVATNAHDWEEFHCLFNIVRLTSDRPSLRPPQSPPPSVGLDGDFPDTNNAIRASNNDCGQLSGQQK